MKGKFIFLVIILTLFLSLSSVYAAENLTEAYCLNDDCDVCDSDNVTLEDDRLPTQINASDVVSYSDLEDNFTVSLSSNGSGLANRTVFFVLENSTYNRTTDSDGNAIFNFKLKNGTYSVSYHFLGDESYTASNGTAEILVKPDIVTYLYVGDEDLNFRQGIKTLFYLRLVDVNSMPISKQRVSISVNGKTYNVTTTAKGYAKLYLSLKKGNYVISYSFNKTGKYLSSNGTFKIAVKAKISKGYGYWVNKWDMYNVNLKKLSKLGTKHIFLLHTVFDKYGEKNVLKWIKKAHKYGMKVHIWISVFYQDGKFTPAASKKGVYNYNHMTSIIKKAKYYASLKGVDGIHFDYVRFPGNAYKYKNAVKAVNYFIKKACKEVRSVKSEIIVSAAVMPEPDSMKYYYAQDIPTMSRYLDVVVPMIYKGNYNANSKWIKKTTKTFVKQSKGALVWSGLQTYKSDSDLTKLSYKALFKDAQAAKKGGASGIVLFRWGLSQLLNFKKL